MFIVISHPVKTHVRDLTTDVLFSLILWWRTAGSPFNCLKPIPSQIHGVPTCCRCQFSTCTYVVGQSPLTSRLAEMGRATPPMMGKGSRAVFSSMQLSMGQQEHANERGIGNVTSRAG